MPPPFVRNPGLKLTIGERIRAERERMGLTAPQAAERLGVSRPTYWQLEQGTDPHLSMLIALADAGWRMHIVATELFRSTNR